MTFDSSANAATFIASSSHPSANSSVTEFRTVFESHIAQVWRILRSMGVPLEQVDDAAQEVFLVVNAKLTEFQGRSTLSTWICAITYRVGANYRRKVWRAPMLAPLADEHLVALTTPEQEVSAAEAAHFVESFCRGLDEGMRDVFVLCLLEEQPAELVAQTLNLNQNTVYSRVRLLRAAFARALEHHQAIAEDR